MLKSLKSRPVGEGDAGAEDRALPLGGVRLWARPLAAGRALRPHSPARCKLAKEMTMKPIVSERCSPPDALELRDVDKPIEPHQVLVRVRPSISVNPAEVVPCTGVLQPASARRTVGQRRPAVRRTDLAGQVEAVAGAAEGVQQPATRYSAPGSAPCDRACAVARRPRLVGPASVSGRKRRRSPDRRQSSPCRRCMTTATSPGRC